MRRLAPMFLLGLLVFTLGDEPPSGFERFVAKQSDAAKACGRKKDWAGAAAAWRKVLELDPHSLTALSGVADAIAAGGNKDAELQARYELADALSRVVSTGQKDQQRTLDAASYGWDDANLTCRCLTLAGYDDWRLPTRIEMVSIVDFTRADPAIDPSAFSGTPSDYFWTSTALAGSAATAWYLFFLDGNTHSGGDDSVYRVRCVRGAEPVTAPGERYSVEQRTLEIEALVAAQDRVTFATLLGDTPTVGFAVVTFIALLDLYRRAVIDLLQDELFTDIVITRREPTSAQN